MWSIAKTERQHPSLSRAKITGLQAKHAFFNCLGFFFSPQLSQVKYELFKKCQDLSVYSCLEQLLAVSLGFRQQQPVLGLPADMNSKVGLCLFLEVVGQRTQNCESCDLAGVSAQPCTNRASTSAK